MILRLNPKKPILVLFIFMMRLPFLFCSYHLLLLVLWWCCSIPASGKVRLQDGFEVKGRTFVVSLGYRTVITRQLPRALQLAQSTVVSYLWILFVSIFRDCGKSVSEKMGKKCLSRSSF